ncbi:hypothetical protein ACFQ0M_45825 [Kitasatospora aburaviensis]
MSWMFWVLPIQPGLSQGWAPPLVHSALLLFQAKPGAGLVRGCQTVGVTS